MAVAFPMPVVAPVTKTYLPLSPFIAHQCTEFGGPSAGCSFMRSDRLQFRLIYMAFPTRRSFLRSALYAGAASPALFHILRAAKPSDIQIDHISFSYQDYLYRTP